MTFKNVGFIGSGRVANIILGGWKRKGFLPEKIMATDKNNETSMKLKEVYPEIQLFTNFQELKGAEIIFLSLHPPVMGEVIPELKNVINASTIVCSLAPKIKISKISELLQGHDKIVRMNPNAPSIVNYGYNPVVFSPGITGNEKAAFLELMELLGRCPETKEENIETYAVISAMGPTYLWFQFYQIVEMAKSFGLSEKEAMDAVGNMAIGAVRTMNESVLPPDRIMDLVPVRPLMEDEAAIKSIYQNRLQAIFQKLKS